jgi:hypothetical protein
MLAHHHAAGNCEGRRHFEGVLAQGLQSPFEVRIAGFSWHVRIPVCEDGFVPIGKFLANFNLAHREHMPQFPMEDENSQMKPGSALPERIGKTPLIRLEQAVRELAGITLLGKAEWANPGGSVKDRAAAAP